MTLKQGEDINKRFVFLSDSIKKVNANFNLYMIENGKRLQKVYNDYNFELNNHKLARAEADSFRYMYMANKKIYLAEEERHRKEIKSLAIITFFTMFMTAVFSSQ